MGRGRSSRVYVEHPEYGSQPRFTGLDVDPDDDGVHLHWNTGLLSEETQKYLKKLGCDPGSLGQVADVIPKTAIVADVDRQTAASYPVTHYYDIVRRCRDCDRRFIFYAVEQKRWYEELEIPLEADCVRCHPCRKEMRELQEKKFRYEELSHRESLSDVEHLELTLCRLELMEAAVFGGKQIDAVRAFLNQNRDHPRAHEIRERVGKISPEASGGRYVKGRRRNRDA